MGYYYLGGYILLFVFDEITLAMLIWGATTIRQVRVILKAITLNIQTGITWIVVNSRFFRPKSSFISVTNMT